MTVPYADSFAGFYDLFHSAKPYDEEVRFVVRQLQNFDLSSGARLLELACGTGEHAWRFAKLGYAVTATDISSSMLEHARAKADRDGVQIEFLQQDMCMLPILTAPFDVAACFFDSIGYVQSDTAIAEVFDGVCRNLSPEGLFIFEYWHAPAMLNGFDPIRVRRFKMGNGTVLRISETELDREKNLAHVTYNVYELRNDSTYRHTSERHTNRFFTVAEMDARAGEHGFVPVAAFAGFQDEAPIGNDTWHIVALWKKVAK